MIAKEPHDILKVYRQDASMEVMEHMQQFNKMSLDDRLEFIYFVLLHTNRSYMYLHEKMFPGETVPHMPELKKDN